MENNKRSICDGEISKEEFQKYTLMFLLKESNISDCAEHDEDFFWFSEVAKARLNNKYYDESNKKAESTYFNLINGICKGLGFEILECSYVNLNPEGGGVSESKDFSSKAKYHWENRKTKIKVLSPKSIICCGTYHELIDLLCNDNEIKIDISDDGAIAKIDGKEVFVINGKHPTSSHEKNTATIERIKIIYDKLENSNKIMQ